MEVELDASYFPCVCCLQFKKPGGKGGLVPFILTFISTFGTLGVKVVSVV